MEGGAGRGGARGGEVGCGVGWRKETAEEAGGGWGPRREERGSWRRPEEGPP